MAKKKAVEEDEGPSQAWLASYADAMTLLLAFFIMMFAFALIDEGKFFDFKVGVVAALGVPDPLTDNTASILSQGTGNFPEIFTPATPTEEEAEEIKDLEEKLAEAGEVTVDNAEDLRELLERKFELAGASEFVQVGVDERGVFIRFDGRVLFESGSADLDDISFSLLATAAGVLGSISNPLEVEGHTDNLPAAGTAWPSNWELSTARSAGVVRWLIDPGGLPDFRLTALGKADTKPVGSNNTAEGRAQNRRVEIVTRVIQTAPAAGSDDSGDDASTNGDQPFGEDLLANDGTDPAETDSNSETDSDTDGDAETDSDTSDAVDAGAAPEEPASLEDAANIDPIENPVGVFPAPEDDTGP